MQYEPYVQRYLPDFLHAQRLSVGSDRRHIIAIEPFEHWVFQTFVLMAGPQ